MGADVSHVDADSDDSLRGLQPAAGHAGASSSWRHPSASVVIPAHNEGSVIERCLTALFTGIDPGDTSLDVVVVCNGCRDDTAARTRSSGYPVRVLELPVASKSAALRAGDAAALALPRLYLDADVSMSGAAALKVVQRLNNGAMAARPPVVYDWSRSSLPVRRYYRARSRLPAVLDCLWGAGVYGLSATGRDRFHEFPDVVADDLWIDSQFDRHEVEIVDCDPVIVTVPRRSRDLLRVLRRTYRGKAENRQRAASGNRARQTTFSVLRDLVRLAVADPSAALDGAAYAWFAVAARLAVRLGDATPGGADKQRWERDDSSRSGCPLRECRGGARPRLESGGGARRWLESGGAR
jgi:glycosyltransferase involved in cell wall biosynthesis